MRLFCGKCGETIRVDAKQLLPLGMRVRDEDFWTYDPGDFLPCPFCQRSRGGLYLMYLDALEASDELAVRQHVEELVATLVDAARQAVPHTWARTQAERAEDDLRWWTIKAAAAGFRVTRPCAACDGLGDVLANDGEHAGEYVECPLCASSSEPGMLNLAVEAESEAYEAFLDPGWWRWWRATDEVQFGVLTVPAPVEDAR